MISVINPANGELVTTLESSTTHAIDEAIHTARMAFDKGVFRQLPMRQKASKLREVGAEIRLLKPELARLESLCNGKLYTEALEDMDDCADVFDYYAGWVDKHHAEVIPTNDGFLNYTQYEPYGVCALIVPWNFPLLLACWKMANALACDNTIVIKPAEQTPLSLICLLTAISDKQLLPPGVVNLVLGGGDVGDYLTHHTGIDKVSFTGSTAVGRKILQASAISNLKPVTLELGGKSPNIIFDDVYDLDEAINRSFTAMFCHKGEKCSEPTRLLVQERSYHQVVDKMITKANAIKCGSPFDATSQQGAQCYRAHFDRILNYIDSGREEGATVVAGGHADTSGQNANGLFIRPTIFVDVKQSMRIVQEEIFGPVLTIQSFKDEEEALHLANDSAYGLAAGFYTRDINRAHRLAKKIKAGMVFINRYGMYDFSSPFGGIKASGWGREMGIHSLESFTYCKSIWWHLGES